MTTVRKYKRMIDAGVPHEAVLQKMVTIDHISEQDAVQLMFELLRKGKEGVYDIDVYKRMLVSGVSPLAVVQKMVVVDGVGDEDALVLLSEILSEEMERKVPDVSRVRDSSVYKKMWYAGVDKNAILQKMIVDGLSEDYARSILEEIRVTVRAQATYRKMWYAGVDKNAILQKMIVVDGLSEDYARSILDEFSGKSRHQTTYAKMVAAGVPHNAILQKMVKIDGYTIEEAEDLLFPIIFQEIIGTKIDEEFSHKEAFINMIKDGFSYEEIEQIHRKHGKIMPSDERTYFKMLAAGVTAEAIIQKMIVVDGYTKKESEDFLYPLLPLVNDEHTEKNRRIKMLKAGVPLEAVQHMVQQSKIRPFRQAVYKRMFYAGVPQDAIINKMYLDGVDTELIQEELLLSEILGVSMFEDIPQKPKFLKMLRAGVAYGAIEQKYSTVRGIAVDTRCVYERMLKAQVQPVAVLQKMIVDGYSQQDAEHILQELLQ